MTLTIHLKPDQIEALPEAMKGGWGHKTGIKLYIYNPINLHGSEIRFLNFEQLNQMGIMTKTDLTNQNIAEIVPRDLNIENS